MDGKPLDAWLEGVDLTGLESETPTTETPTPQPLPRGTGPVMVDNLDEKRTWFRERMLKLANDVQNVDGLLPDGTFKPSQAIVILVDEENGFSADINMGMTKQDLVYWLEEMKQWIFKLG